MRYIKDYFIKKSSILILCLVALTITLISIGYSSFVRDYWLETSYTSREFPVWIVNGTSASVSTYSASNSDDVGVRPAIDVLKTDIEI